ncbi:hypothetical protein E2C01_048315 [Portunus trituberculatus]|uniref:Uncharacterized protein n=1 Tax=Portunus trituberculatus TaxID=210409 RepID=A0A5B7G9V9_PORTR|nr:hypothetical protein [Portunus trituberculatus]
MEGKGRERIRVKGKVEVAATWIIYLCDINDATPDCNHGNYSTGKKRTPPQNTVQGDGAWLGEAGRGRERRDGRKCREVR